MMGGPGGMLNQETSKPRSASSTLGRLVGYFAPYWYVLLVVLILVLVSSWTQVITPTLTGQAFDCFITPATVQAFASDENLETASGQSEVQPTASQTNCTFDQLPADATQADYMWGLGRIALLMLAVAVAGAIASGLQFFLMTWSGQHVLRRLQNQLFRHLETLSLGYYSKVEIGDLMSRITNDVSTIQQALNFALIQVLGGIVTIVWIAYTMLRANWAYALVSLAIVPFLALATIWFSRQARKAFRRTRKEIGNVNAELAESISGVREVQAFSREGANIESFQQTNAANRDANIRAVAYTSALNPTLEALGYVGLAIVAGVGGLAMLNGLSLGGQVVSIGLIVAFIGYVQRFNQPVAQIAIMWTNIQSAIAGAERIFELLDVNADIVDKSDAIAMPPIEGRVVFKEVGAEYVKGEPVLQGINVVAEKGQVVAIVGPTGAGKTTFVNLIPRFYDVTHGSVTIDGVDVRDVSMATLRKQIGIVLQDSFLFGDTVLNNIRYGRPDATDAEVIAAAKMAHAHDFIERLSNGYETVLGERGGGLSQGQRQLISIARAALANPQILILDEATSSVDTRTERQIQAALEQLLEGRTSFVIAHRLSTIRNADQVLVLVNGEIAERGTHDELLALQGVYYDLYMSQFRRQEEVTQRSSGMALAPAGA